MSFDKLLARALEQRTEANNKMMEGLYGGTALPELVQEELRARVRELHVIIRWLRKEMENA